jgi:antitoxin component HigA of HigAB toxin-antitoxin module
MKAKRKIDPSYFGQVQKFPLVPVDSEKLYEQASDELGWLAAKGSELSEGEQTYMEVLAMLVAAYEEQVPSFLDEPVSPVEALKYLMEQQQLTQLALSQVIGYPQSHISDFLTGKRGASNELAFKLGDYFAVLPTLFMSRGK